MDNFTPDIQKALYEMFSTEGWQYFIEDIQSNLNNVNNLDNVVGEQQLGFRQGQATTLRGITRYEDAIKAATEHVDEAFEDELEHVAIRPN